MIRVVFWQGAGESLIGFTVKGHAGYRPKGEDIVCAAVSALAQTAILSLREQLPAQPQVTIADGDLGCRLPAGLNSAGLEKAQVILKTIAIGLKAVACDYKDYVQLEYKMV